MKFAIIILGLLVSNSLVYAGGNENSDISTVADISATSCQVNKVYTEKDTQLMWQDQKYTDAEDGAFKRNHSVGKAGSWNYAMNYCASLDYQGYSDWRLPTADELTHVHNKTGKHLIYSRAEDFWTSTPSTENKYYVVYPPDAYRYKRNKNVSSYIRCVRCKADEKKSSLYRIVKERVNEVVTPEEPVTVDTFQ